jgi:CHAD domain-containing protein
MGPSANRLAKAIADLQTCLGDHQDTVVAESWLREVAAADPATGLAAGQLIALERFRRTELRAQWPAVWEAASRKRLRRWLRPPAP